MSGALPSPSTQQAGGIPSTTRPTPNVASCCPQEKWQYERCFQKWYNAEYLTGKSQDLSGCKPLFDTYRACVLNHYEKNEPDFLLQAAAASDQLLVSSGLEPFNTKYPNIEKDKKPTPTPLAEQKK